MLDYIFHSNLINFIITLFLISWIVKKFKILSHIDKKQEFINKSMLYNEINGQIGKLLDQQKDLDAQLTKREEGFKYLRTPFEVLSSLYEDKQRVNMMRGKKQKALLRKIANTEAEYKSVHDDYKKYPRAFF